MRGHTITETTTLVTEECCTCGVLFAITKDLYDRCQRESGVGTGRAFYCPNGHQQWYVGKSDEQKLREAQAELRAERDNAAFWKSEEAKRKRELAKAKREATALKKRTAAGVCPCCNRSFVQLARHMKGQHPDYAEAP